MDEAPLTRQELMAGYQRPYARWLPVAWRIEHVHRNLLLALGAVLAALAADQIDGRDPILLVLTLFGALGVLVWSLGVTAQAALIVHGRIRDWEESRHELAAVRRRRPHADEADADVVHVEYAVAVGEAGHLITWRFRPLEASEAVPANGVLITGKPCYVATAIGSAPYDPIDAGRAAEQLADAQQRAAELEQMAIESAAQRLQEQHAAKELAVEAESTGAALRGITGQSGPER